MAPSGRFAINLDLRIMKAMKPTTIEAAQEAGRRARRSTVSYGGWPYDADLDKPDAFVRAWMAGWSEADDTIRTTSVPAWVYPDDTCRSDAAPGL